MTLVLTVIPLWWFRRAGLRIHGRNRYLTYFAGLGLAFMLLELALMQKLSLYLGHPTYSISVVLSTVLVFSGLGSLTSGVLPWRHVSVIRISIASIVIVVLLYLALLPALIDRTFALPFAIRVSIVVGLIGPLSFFMGMPFPCGLRLITRSGERFVPWAWGVNGIASVLGSVAAIFLAMSFGFTFVLICGAGCYVIAALSLTRIDHEA